MQTPQTVLEFLRAQRAQTPDRLAGMRGFEVAVCEVFDELIRRAEVIADEYPAGQAITRAGVREAPAVTGALGAIMKTVGAIGDRLSDCVAAAQVRREPLMRFVDRIGAEGFEVGEDWTVTDTRPGPPPGDPAEQAARTAQAAVYQQRLIRMVTAFDEVLVEHAQRVRDLVPTVLDG